MANTKPKKKWSELTPSYRKRLESAYKSGKFGEGYASAGRAYSAGASRTVARGQANEKERRQRRVALDKAKKWATKHSRSEQTDYRPPKNITPADEGKYAQDYLEAMTELEKGWSNTKVTGRKQVDWSKVEKYWADYDVKGFDEYFPLI